MNLADIELAASSLIAARNDGNFVDTNSIGLAPSTRDDAYRIQATVAAELGEIGGWKVGASSPTAEPTIAPIHRSGIFQSGATLVDGSMRMRGIEIEVGFILRSDLDEQMCDDRDRLIGAIEALVPIVEVVETRLNDRAAADGLWALADNQSHGELIVGTPVADWQAFHLDAIPIRLEFDGSVIVDRLCHNLGGHPLDLVQRLARVCGDHCGGLRAGQIITTGSYSGLDCAPARAYCLASLDTIGEVSVHFQS